MCGTGFTSRCCTGIVARRLMWQRCEGHSNQEVPQIPGTMESQLAAVAKMPPVFVPMPEGSEDVFWWSSEKMVRKDGR